MSANFRTFFVSGISYRPTDLSLLKGFSKKEIFIILFEQDCPEAVVHDLAHVLMKQNFSCKYKNFYTIFRRIKELEIIKYLE